MCPFLFKRGDFLNVSFYRFPKRRNSTKIPDSGAVTFSCELKSTTSIINPVLIIRAVPSNLAPIWNYAYIPIFQRYYFVTNWNYLNGVWEIDCVVDVLASFKTYIGNLSEYVLRSSHEYNGQVVDLQYPTTAETRVDARMLTRHFQSDFGGGYYVIGIISNDSASAQGAVTYYQMTAAQMATLKNYMMSDTFMTEQGLDVQFITDVIPNEVLKTLYDPFKYIASCIWLPFDPSEFDSALKTSVNVKFGWWTPTTNIPAYRLFANGYVKHYSERISISGHPQRFDRGVWLDHAPFVDRMLYYPPFGSVPINDDSIIGGDFLRVEMDVDMILGDAVLTVFHDRPLGNDSYRNMGVIARLSAPLAVPIQLAQTTVDVEGSVSAMQTSVLQGVGKSTVSAINNLKAGGGLLDTLSDFGRDVVQGGVSAIGDVLTNPVGQLQTSGTNGSLAQYSVWPYFVEKWRIVADDDNAQHGRPLCQVKTLNTIPGFIMVDTPDVSTIPCLAPELQQIIAFLSGGFFYE